MTDLQALQAACRAAPDDNAPVLVLADYYQENGYEATAKDLRRFIRKRTRVRERLAQRGGQPTKRIKKLLARLNHSARYSI